MNLTECTRFCLEGMFFIIEKSKLMSVMTSQINHTLYKK